MKGIILHKEKQGFTYLNPIFEAMDNVQEQFNWLITECDEWEDIFAGYQCHRGKDYVWIKGYELTRLVKKNKDVQMIWGVLSGFEADCSVKEVLKYPRPYADMNRSLWQSPVIMQNPLASVEIVAFDSSCTLIKSRDEKLLEKIMQAFKGAEDLESFNQGESHDEEAYERWLKEKGSRCEECKLYETIPTSKCPVCGDVVDLLIQGMSLSLSCRRCNYGLASTANPLCLCDNGKYGREWYDKIEDCPYAVECK